MGRRDDDDDDDDGRESRTRLVLIVVIGALALFGIVSGAMWLAGMLHPA